MVVTRYLVLLHLLVEAEESEVTGTEQTEAVAEVGDMILVGLEVRGQRIRDMMEVTEQREIAEAEAEGLQPLVKQIHP